MFNNFDIGNLQKPAEISRQNYDSIDRLSDAGEPPGNNQDSANSGQNVNQYPSEYEILTESEIEDKFHQGDNSEMTLEMGKCKQITYDFSVQI